MKRERRERTAQEEVAPGFFETRRRLLWLPAWALGGATVIFGQPSAQMENRGNPQGAKMSDSQMNAAKELGWQSFLDECLPTAQTLHKDSSASGQDAYLFWLASMIRRVKKSEIPRAKLGRFGSLEPPAHFGVLYRGTPFFMVEWWLEPGAVLPPHCHPNVSVCTVAVEGEARIRNFEVVGQAPEFSSSQTFTVRQTHDEILTPGRVNMLSALRDNIHTFQAGAQGARGFDITTYHGPDASFSFLDIAAKPKDAEQRVYEAVWKGKKV